MEEGRSGQAILLGIRVEGVAEVAEVQEMSSVRSAPAVTAVARRQADMEGGMVVAAAPAMGAEAVVVEVAVVGEVQEQALRRLLLPLSQEAERWLLQPLLQRPPPQQPHALLVM